MMDKERVHLDLEKIDLYGWEGSVNKYKFDSVIRGINAGDRFPPVRVFKINEHIYQLTDLATEDESRKEGGHTRSFAHYKTKKPLECVVEGMMEHVDFDEFGEINIRDLKLDDGDYARTQFEKIKKEDQKYR